MPGGIVPPWRRSFPVEKVKIARVAVAAATYAIDKPYDYLIPALLESFLEKA